MTKKVPLFPFAVASVMWTYLPTMSAVNEPAESVNVIWGATPPMVSPLPTDSAHNAETCGAKGFLMIKREI